MSDDTHFLELAKSFLHPPEWKPNVTSHLLTIVAGFSDAVPRVVMDDGTVLRNWTAEDSRVHSSDFHFPQLLSSNQRTLIESTMIAASFDDAVAEARERAERLVLALRLLKPGSLVLRDTKANQEGIANGVHSSWSDLIWNWQPTPTFEDEYRLVSQDVALVRELYSGLSRHFSRAAEVAFRRFGIAHTRTETEDRLLDHWVGLESLFAKQGETQELSYKFALRIAHYTGDSSEDRLRVFNAMRDAYVVRSKVVHGQATQKGIDHATSQTESALRNALRRAVLEGAPPDIETLDKKAASGR